MNDLISDLKWRGLIKDVTDINKLTQAINNKDRFYLGIDPTGESIHIGHMLAINLTRILSNHNLKPTILIGGATASIGDPSGKNEERETINYSILAKNIDMLTSQLKGIFKNDVIFKKNNDFLILNNWEWYYDLDLIKFLRDYGKKINLSTMISKDNVKNRLNSGISFTEFSYMLLQAYDWLVQYEKYNTKIQIGGSDQWGNIVTGTELIRKVKKNDEVVGLTTNLLLDKNNNKIGKTSKGEVIWLNENKTSSFKLYQYLLNFDDKTAMDLTKKITMISKEEFSKLQNELKLNPSKKVFQHYNAKYILTYLKHKTNYERVKKVSDFLFSNKYDNLEKKDFQIIFKEIKAIEVTKNSFLNQSLINILEKHKLINSRRELRELINSKTVMLNDKLVKKETDLIKENHLFFDTYLILRLSKKNRLIFKIK